MAKVAILGFGTVGSGVAEVLTKNAESITRKAGEPVEVKYILDLRDFADSPFADKIINDFSIIENDPEVSVVAECIGGSGAARNFTTRALQALEKAELVLLVLDSSSGVTAEDQRLLDLTEGRNRIILYNKKDQVELPDTIAISAKEKDLDALVKAIEEKYDSEIHAANEDTLNNERQIGLAMQARTSMQEAVRSLESGLELDLVTLDLQAAYNALKEITGEATREGLLDEIFSRFCLGK